MTPETPPCTKCGSPDTKPYTVKAAKSGKKPGETAHRCGPDCEQAVTFCRNCHFTR